MNIDINLMLTISAGILLASLIKHIVAVAFNQRGSSGSASHQTHQIGSASSYQER